jgi:hypothetical protein
MAGRSTRDADTPDSTLSDLGGRHPGGALWVRRSVGLVMLGVVIVAATGLLGVHSQTVSAHADGYTLSVEYAGVARAGLDVPLRVRVTPDGKFGDKLTLAIDREYLAIFETQGFHPEPSDTANQGDDVLLTFDTPPDGSPLVVDYDAYIQPASQAGAAGRISVMHGTERATTVRFATFLFP